MKLLILALTQIYTKLPKHPEKGAYIVKFHIHIDTLSMERISGSFIPGLNLLIEERASAEKYFNEIFNDLNNDLRQHDIQLEPDYSQLLIEELNIKLDMENMCKTNMVLPMAVSTLLFDLSYPKIPGMGNRIIVIACPFTDPRQLPYLITPSGMCGNLSTILMFDRFTARFLIKSAIKNVVSTGMNMISSISSSRFKKGVNNYVNRCVKGNDYYGYFEKNLTDMNIIIND